MDREPGFSITLMSLIEQPRFASTPLSLLSTSDSVMFALTHLLYLLAPRSISLQDRRVRASELVADTRVLHLKHLKDVS